MLSVPSVLIYNTREAPYVRHLVAYVAGACGGHFGCKWLHEGLAHPPMPWSMPRARYPLSGLNWSPAQSKVFVKQERPWATRRLQLCVIAIGTRHLSTDAEPRVPPPRD